MKTTGAEPKILRDGAGARTQRADNLHQVRYIEIFLAGRQATTGKLVAATYNTTFAYGRIPASKDAAPQALVEGLDFEQMTKDHGVVGASLNGPKRWMLDWTVPRSCPTSSSTSMTRLGRT